MLHVHSSPCILQLLEVSRHCFASLLLSLPLPLLLGCTNGTKIKKKKKKWSSTSLFGISKKSQRLYVYQIRVGNLLMNFHLCCCGVNSLSSGLSGGLPPSPHECWVLASSPSGFEQPPSQKLPQKVKFSFSLLNPSVADHMHEIQCMQAHSACTYTNCT